MLASITPLGERGRRQRWTITVAAHVAASALGGAVAGALAGALGHLVLGGVSPDGRVLFVALLLAGGLALDVVRRVPGPQRQVDESWLDRYRGWVYGAGFGLQLGAGVVTIVSASAVYVVLGAAMASASPAAGALLGLGAGLLRGATVLATAAVRTPAALMRFHVRMRTWREPVRVAGLVAQALVLAAVVGALGS